MLAVHSLPPHRELQLKLRRRPHPSGTWAAGDWAVQFYQSKGFALIDEAEEKDRLLRTYWFCEVRFRLQSPLR
jgi:hypothetical protein